MSIENRKLQLRDVQGNLVFPRASLDNIQISKNDGRDAVVVTLDSTGHISSAIIPNSANLVEMLLSLSIIAPTGAVEGDRYYNISQNKIYTYSNFVWGDAETPDVKKIYLAKDTNNIYRYNGTSAMTEVTAHYTIFQNIADDPTIASLTGIPSEHAVSVALQRKQDLMTGVAPISVDGTGSISLNRGAGLDMDGDNLTVRQDYIVETVNDLMMRDAGPASPEVAQIDGGTVYTLLGDYGVTNVIRSSGSDDTCVTTEKSVRDAINAYVATGGSTITAGQAINMNGGSINVTASTIGQVLGATIYNNTVTHIVQDDLSALTPGNLKSAMSLAQSIDVSVGPWNSTTGTQITEYLNGFTVSAVNGTTIGFYDTGTHKFPKFASSLKYLFICDVKGSGSITPNGGTATTLTNTNKRLTLNVSANNTGFFKFTGNATCTFSNWRQYEVTNCTTAAVNYLGGLTHPDKFFRDTSAYNVIERYMIRQDMVSPFIPVISMPDNSDLTVGAGLAYSLKYTDNNIHKITVDTIPTNGYGRDAHIALFVKETANVAFIPPLNLISSLTPNAGHNLTVKFRSGQANVYIDDTDIGYVVSVVSGSTYGSLQYGMNTSSVGKYIVFSNNLNGSTVSATGTTIGRALNLVGNGMGNTIISIPDVKTTYNGNVALTDLTIIDGQPSLVSATNLTSNRTDFRNIEIRGMTYTNRDNNCIIGGHTISNFDITGCYIHDNYTTSDMIFGKKRLVIKGTTISNCYTPGYLLYQNFTMQDCIISGNTCSGVCYFGSDIYLYNVTNCCFSNNSGSALMVDVRSDHLHTVFVTGCTFATSTDNITVTESSCIKFDGVNILNSTISNAGYVRINGGTIYSNTETKGLITGTGYIQIFGSTVEPTVIENIDIKNFIIPNSVAIINPGVNIRQNTIFNNCEISGNTTSQYTLAFTNGGSCTFNNCKIWRNVTGTSVGINCSCNMRFNNCLYGDYRWNYGGYIYVDINGVTFTENGTFYDNAWAGHRSHKRILSSSVIDCTSLEDNRVVVGVYFRTSVGSFDSTGHIYTVGGTATVLHRNGSTTISGIGTTIRADGTTDLSEAYIVTNANASGEGSLLNGLLGSYKHIVINHPITSCSAVLTSTVSKQMVLYTGDGMPLIGGGATVTIPSGSTVTINTILDEYGAAHIGASGSTVTVSGGVTFSEAASWNLNTTFVPISGFTNVNRASGYGNSYGLGWTTNCIDLSGKQYYNGNNNQQVFRAYTIKNGRYNGEHSSDTYGGGGGAYYSYNRTYPQLQECTIQDCYSSNRGGGVHVVGGTFNFASCTVTGCTSVSYGSGASLINCRCILNNTKIIGNTAGICGAFFEGLLANSTITNSCFVDNTTGLDVIFHSGPVTVSGSTIGTGQIKGATVNMSGKNTIKNSFTQLAGGSGLITIASGATLSLVGSTVTEAITAGTISVLDTCTVIDKDNVSHTVSAGNYVTITNQGTAY